MPKKFKVWTGYTVVRIKDGSVDDGHGRLGVELFDKSEEAEDWHKDCVPYNGYRVARVEIREVE